MKWGFKMKILPNRLLKFRFLTKRADKWLTYVTIEQATCINDSNSY